MKITFLGTAGSEGMPAMFCNCPICEEGRRRGGKDIRTRSQTIINNDLLIDFSCDSYMHTAKYGVDFSNVRYLIITHSHSDHFYPEQLEKFIWARVDGNLNLVNDVKLSVLGNQSVLEGVRNTKISDNDQVNLQLFEANDFEKIIFGKYEITPFPAHHDMENQKAKIYLISDGEKTIFYGLDTGVIYEEIFEYLRDNEIHIDLCVFDCTAAFMKFDRVETHMNYEMCSKMKSRMFEYGAASESTIFCVNHFSHNANPLHNEMCDEGEKRGFQVAYDNFSLTI